MATQLMKDSLHTGLNIEDICQHTHYSRTRLYNIFKSRSNLGPIDYYLNLKMETAARMLINTNYSIAEVAQLVGIEDPLLFLTPVQEDQRRDSPQVKWLSCSKYPT
jgi:AraC-like DNA-binding protein